MGLAADISVACPYCAAEVEIFVDAGGGADQVYIEDCAVCCQPWSVRVLLDGHGVATVHLTTLDEA